MSFLLGFSLFSGRTCCFRECICINGWLFQGPGSGIFHYRVLKGPGVSKGRGCSWEPWGFLGTLRIPGNPEDSWRLGESPFRILLLGKLVFSHSLFHQQQKPFAPENRPFAPKGCWIFWCVFFHNSPGQAEIWLIQGYLNLPNPESLPPRIPQ